ncbi:MAG: polar amino acid transport system substrate-binding protein [Alteromonadaceae bacterium]|jgi:polar amino acid transport system substrate-binding protein
MDTKSFVSQLNQITNALLTMTPAQREVVHLSIQGSQGEISVNELFQPIFDNLSQCPHYYSPHFKKWVLKPLYFPLGRIPLAFRNNTVDAVMGDRGIDLSPFGGSYADPAIIYDNVFINLTKNKVVIKEPKDLENLTVVSFQGAEKRYPQWLKIVKEEKRFYGISDQFTQVKLLILGRYDVVLSDRYIFNYFVKQMKLINNISPVYIDEHKFIEANSDNYRPVF